MRKKHDPDGGATCECGKRWDHTALYAHFIRHDYSSDFEIACECGRFVLIESVPVPEFSYSVLDKQQSSPRTT